MNHEVKHDLNSVLNMTGPQGNIGVGLFYAAYIIFEVVIWFSICCKIERVYSGLTYCSPNM
jgi:hypothetical protein